MLQRNIVVYILLTVVPWFCTLVFSAFLWIFLQIYSSSLAKINLVLCYTASLIITCLLVYNLQKKKTGNKNLIKQLSAIAVINSLIVTLTIWNDAAHLLAFITPIIIFKLMK